MLKNIQIRIILVFILLGILLITVLGGIFMYEMRTIGETIEDVALQEQIQMKLENVKMIIVYSIVIYGLISIILGIFVVKVIISPVSKLVKSAEKIASGETINIDYLTSQITEESNKGDIDDLIKAFRIMTSELQENLNETTRQKKQIETILLHMTDGIIAFNIEGEILHINPAAIQLLNIPSKEEYTFDKIFSKLDMDMNIEKIIYLDNWTSSEQKIKLHDKYINLLFAPFQDENDRQAGVIVVIQDITEHVKLDNMRKEFVADVSHELKTPITSIMGYAETLSEGDYDKETREHFLEVIVSESKRMAKLVHDLLTLSKYDSKKTEPQKTTFDLGDLVKSCQDKLQIEMDKKKIKAECFVTAEVPNVYADKAGIERVVLNILSNSIKYTNDNGTVKIYVGFVYNDAYIKIIDNGVGIPGADLNKIFERFYRVDKARSREAGGTGLGLSIAKEILDNNGGSIDIKSEFNKGTEVVIRIPTKK